MWLRIWDGTVEYQVAELVCDHVCGQLRLDIVCCLCPCQQLRETHLYLFAAGAQVLNCLQASVLLADVEAFQKMMNQIIAKLNQFGHRSSDAYVDVRLHLNLHAKAK